MLLVLEPLVLLVVLVPVVLVLVPLVLVVLLWPPGSQRLLLLLPICRNRGTRKKNQKILGGGRIHRKPE
jgi:hypothetical protein